ncbi:MAG: cyclic nucleotide-binding domain-containing protein [Myxococcales bacterium]
MANTKIDSFKPRLRDSAQVRLRSDGSAGVWDTATGRSLEIADDQAPLLLAIDGERTLTGVAEAHAEAKGYVPFTALRDLMQGLSRQDLLANPPEEIAAAGLAATRRRNERWADSRIATFPMPFVGPLAAVVSLAALGAAAFLTPDLNPEPTGWDVLWAYGGAALALTLRGFFRGAAASALGRGPLRLRIASCFGVLHLEPDGGSVALLDRNRRALAHFAAILGAMTAAALSWSCPVPGLAAGALAVLLANLVPFEPTSMGKLFSVMAGRVDLREHARAYLTRRFLLRAVSRQFFDGEASLILSLLASLAWFVLLIQVLFRQGFVAVLQMMRVAVDTQTSGIERALALLGGGVLTLLMPAAVLGLVWALGRAILSVRPPKASAQGTVTTSTMKAKDLAAIPVFAYLSPEQLDKLTTAVKEIAYQPGEKIVSQGDPGDRFFAIRCGQAKVEHELPSGLVHEVAQLGAGDCFGETALLENAPRSASVRAATPVTVAALSKTDFDQVIASLGGADITRLLRAAAALHKSRFFERLPADRLGFPGRAPGAARGEGGHRGGQGRRGRPRVLPHRHRFLRGARLRRRAHRRAAAGRPLRRDRPLARHPASRHRARRRGRHRAGPGEGSLPQGHDQRPLALRRHRVAGGGARGRCRMMKVLLGRVLPIGAAIALLSSSASPLSGALNGFAHAANALGGAQNEDSSDMTMPDEASVNAAIGQVGTGGFSLTKMFKNLFGNSESDKAKAQLDQIIANVKGRSASGQPGIPVEGAKAGKGATGTKTPAGTKGKAGGGASKAGAGKSLTTPAPTAPPPAGGAGEGAAAGSGAEGGGASP